MFLDIFIYFFISFCNSLFYLNQPPFRYSIGFFVLFQQIMFYVASCFCASTKQVTQKGRAHRFYCCGNLPPLYKIISMD